MDLPDPSDLAEAMLPRRVKRLIFLAFVVLCLVNMRAATWVIEWYGHYEASKVVHQIENTLPTAPPTPPVRDR